MTSFFVPGVPVPKGSAKAFYIKKINRTVVTQTNAAKQKPWASLIAVKAEEAHVILSVSGAVRLNMTFLLPRPRSHYRSGANAALLKDSAPKFPVSKPDVDKLVRCVADALTEVAYRDDSQVTAIYAEKVYAVASEGAGVQIDVILV